MIIYLHFIIVDSSDFPEDVDLALGLEPCLSASETYTCQSLNKAEHCTSCKGSSTTSPQGPQVIPLVDPN